MELSDLGFVKFRKGGFERVWGAFLITIYDFDSFSCYENIWKFWFGGGLAENPISLSTILISQTG